MPRTVSKSISAGAKDIGRFMACLLSLSALSGVAAAAAPTAQNPGGPKPAALQKPAVLPAPAAQKATAPQVKKLDDGGNKEVLRPIPPVLKNPPAAPTSKPKPTQSPAQSPAQTSVPAKANPAAAVKTTPTSAAKDSAAKETAAKDSTGKKAQADEKPKNKVRKSANLGAHFVPPPPPSTPTMLGDGDFGMYSGMPVEMLSKEALKDRAKEISIQYKDASRELEDRSREKEEKIQRAKEFEGLFQEGVVSKRELEASQREAGTVNSDIDRLTFKANELKGLLDRINKRLAPQAAKKHRAQLIN